MPNQSPPTYGPPTIEGTFGQKVPRVFIRKLRRKSDWPTPDMIPTQITEDIVQQIFEKDPIAPKFSLYSVESDEDLQRVLLALNATNPQATGLDREAFLVAFLPDELTQYGLLLEHTVGDVECERVRNLHFDAQAPKANLQQLITDLVATGRKSKYWKSKEMEKAVDIRSKDRCRTFSIKDSSKH